MRYIQTIKMILSLLPLLLEAIRAVENAFPGKDQGASKLQLVKTALEVGHSAANDAVMTFEEAWPALNTVIDSAVTIYNATGAFKK